jgi:ferritin
MINKKVEEAINKQINAELYSAYLYLSMDAYFHSINLPGFANWMRIQALEEFTHADKFYAFLVSRNGRVKLTAVDAPPVEWKSPLNVFEEVLKHEQKVTALIGSLVDLSLKEKDHATNSMLKWFVDEQVEEESNADGIIQQLKLMGDSGHGLYMLDKELATRIFVPPIQAQP